MLQFELLCLDIDDKTNIKTAEQMAYSFASNNKLFKKPEVVWHKISDTSNSIKVDITIQETDSGVIFWIICTWDYKDLESFRKTLLEHLKNQSYGRIYILQDNISSQISQDIYPMLNEVENGLRKYLIRFFITKIWANWWSITADIEMNKKVNHRKNNEMIFRDYIDNNVYLIDFWELGKMVYSQSSWFIDKQDILNRVLALDETPEAVQKLKNELDTNYNKFFKDTFKDNNFQEKWEQFEKIRNRVAHNNLFTNDDKVQAIELHKTLMDIIHEANGKIDTIEFSEDEQTEIQETIVNSPFLDKTQLKYITREELLEKLDWCERWAKEKRDWFLSLKHFVVNYLWSVKYDFAATNGIINQLVEEGVIELYDYESASNPFPIKAIRKKPIN